MRVVVVVATGIMVVVLAIGMPFTTVPPLVVTTPEAVPLVSIGLGLVLGIGMGVGTTVPGAAVAGAGVMTVPGVAVITGVLYTGPDIRFRIRLKSPRRVEVVVVVVITVGAVGAITVPDGTGGGTIVVEGGSAARAFTANRQATATANSNRFTLLPPETRNPLTPGRPFSRGRSGSHSVATERTAGNGLIAGSQL